RKNADFVRPIASVTKLLSGLLLSDMVNDDTESVTICEDDKDRLKWSRSRLPVGLTASWGELVHAALGASENRAMYAAVRSRMTRAEFVELMNRKAVELGMQSSHFIDPAGIDPGNVSTANDLLELLSAAAENEQVCSWTLTPTIALSTGKGA